jgi:hypothetical protein
MRVEKTKFRLSKDSKSIDPKNTHALEKNKIEWGLYDEIESDWIDQKIRIVIILIHIEH